jgi:hypothetical protein
MFDGTDLSVAYGNSFDAQQQQHSPTFQQMQPPPDPTSIPKATASHAIPPDQQYAPPPAMYAQQSPKPPPSIAPPSDSFWDRVAGKKWEVFKLFVMSLIILLALSLDNVACHYLTKYISGSFLTDNQELLVRLGYPVAILLFIWVLKASA